MAKKDSWIRTVILLLLSVGVRLNAQVVETPIAFDSAGRVRSLTPVLVVQLGLAPPAWPVPGSFVQARAFSVSTGDYVLVAERPSGVFERYSLSEAQLDTLRSSVDAAMAVIGARVGEDRPDVFSEPARGAFLRNQMIIAAGLYGPLIAALTDDAKAGPALYLITVGGSYFALNNISKTTPITRAQNDLATDGALRGAAVAAGLVNAFGGDDIHRRTYSALALTGAVAGSVTGFRYGKRLTDSEAHASMTFSTFAAGTALGIVAAVTGFDGGNGSERVAAASMVAAGLAGYVLGPNYPRRARYTVTAGDVRLLPIGALLGAMTGVTLFAENHDARLPATAATLGGWAGILAIDRAWVRPYDHGAGHVTQVWLGTIAGGLLGGAGIVLTESDAVIGTAMVAAGGILGAIAGHSLAAPTRVAARGARESSGAPGSRLTRRVRVNPAALALVAGRVAGPHALISVRF